ncbi:MAG: DUF3365 domain-containing protein [Mariniblastus sp.]|nr:DUF3365 domain-containing protein [Mariniblastus sp.]
MKLFDFGLVVALLGCLLCPTSGCSSNSGANRPRDSAASWTPLSKLSEQQSQQKDQALAAKEKLLSLLLGELMTSLGDKGPAMSIRVCKTRAPEIAAQVNEETGIQIGRTSFNLRNTENAAPEWAVNFVNEKVETPVEVALPDEELGVLLPIHLQATCTLCHGNDDQIMPEVRAAISSNYPDDKATGFAEGDLRGYFWIQVPSLEKTKK